MKKKLTFGSIWVDDVEHTTLDELTLTPKEPPPEESLAGTRIPPANRIIDHFRKVWTLAGHIVTRDGVDVPLTFQAKALGYEHELVYVLSVKGQWFAYDYVNDKWRPATNPFPASI